ncbi:unnamed protein product [Haemonchus placei]|uniref:Uncharacterized protein n=1 Tax=Haemonchus placei TaxID=6290 RepID=A0A0N4W494_HAEPC|nr:unnamed protein product [Haemonchus placei]
MYGVDWRNAGGEKEVQSWSMGTQAPVALWRYRERERTTISEAGAEEGRSDSALSYHKVYKTWHDNH